MRDTHAITGPSLRQIVNDSGSFGVTIYPFTITEVIVGNVEKMEMEIAERYYTKEENGSRTLVSMEGYIPSEFHTEYLFFLCLNDDEGIFDGIYYPIQKGRYDMDELHAHAKAAKTEPDLLIPGSIEMEIVEAMPELLE